jgi:hypothetical protein
MASHNTMLNTDKTQFDNHDILKLDANVFAPMLDECLIARNPPLFVEPLLMVEDFTNEEFANVFLDHFDDTSLTLSRRFSKDNNPALLNKDQWLRASTQLMAMIQCGIYHSFPIDDIPTFVLSLRPNEDSALKVFGSVVRSLNYFLTNLPDLEDTAQWHQCARCLKVSSPSVSEEDWEAALITCQHHADAARAFILNATIRSF